MKKGKHQKKEKGKKENIRKMKNGKHQKKEKWPMQVSNLRPSRY